MQETFCAKRKLLRTCREEIDGVSRIESTAKVGEIGSWKRQDVFLQVMELN